MGQSHLSSFTKKLFGLSETGRSLLGKHAQNLLWNREIRHEISIVLILAIVSVYILHNFSNIGGFTSFNLASGNIPKIQIDARTVSSFQVPIDYAYQSRGFSWFHAGADLVAPTGTPVRPITEGTVKEANPNYFGYGNMVVVSHPNGLESLYGHLSQIGVKAGDKVRNATELGKSGSTGLSTGPHLHLEVRQNGVLVNPAEIVPGVN